MRNNKKIINVLIINIIIILLELFALSCTFFRFLPEAEDTMTWYSHFTKYTTLSNIFLLIVSIIIVVVKLRELKGRKTFDYSILKYTSVVVISVTFITIVVFALIFLKASLLFDIKAEMFMLLHTICPILGLISYILFDDTDMAKRKDKLYPALFTILYTVFIELVYFFGGDVPYINDFGSEPLAVNGWEVLLAGVIELSLTLTLAVIIRIIKNKIQTKKAKNEQRKC